MRKENGKFSVRENIIRSLVASRIFLSERLSAPVDAASLAFFRIAFGVMMLWEVWRYFSHGWIDFY